MQRREAAYTYNANGQRLSLTDARGYRAEMRYDGFGRQQRWIFPSKSSAGVADQADYEQYQYDSAGNRTKLRKRDGSELTFQYDALNRMTAKIVPDRLDLAPAQTRDVYYDYDLRGLQTKARFDSLAGEGVTNAYDGFGLLVSSTSNMGGVARATGNLYDGDGNRIRVIHPDTSFFTYEVDGLGRPLRIRENGADALVAFTYDSAGRRASTGWAAITSYAYDPVGRLQTLSHDLAGASRDQTQGFTYNPASQIQSRSASNPAYAWGGASNAVRNYAANGLNQYTVAGPATFDHDLNGNLSSTVNPSFGSTSYAYDIENRLVSASGAQAAEFVYDPLGRLSQVSSGGAGIRRLVYDGDALVAEYDSAGNMPHRYIHGNDAGADDPLIWYDNFAWGWRRALLTDHQGSVIQVADMYGNPIATNTYDPWGIPGATPAGRFGYTGQTWVPELGLWYYKARFYSPTTGRFLQVDPVGYEDQMNLYAYVGNDPVNGTDPSGEWCLFGYGSTCPNANKSAAATGATAATAVAAREGIGAQRARASYQQSVRRLGPNDSAARSAVKQAARAATPPITRSVIQIVRPGTGPRPGSGGTANSTSAAADRLAGRLGTIGRFAAGANVAIGVARVATSDHPAQEAARVGGGIAGAIAGAEALGAVGALGGPWGAAAGGIIGGIAGGFGGEAMVDRILGND